MPPKIGKKKKLPESKKQVEVFENAENVANTKPDIDVKYVEIMKLAHRINTEVSISLEQRDKVDYLIDATKKDIDKLFNELINSNDVKLDDIIIFGNTCVYLANNISLYLAVYTTSEEKKSILLTCADYLLNCLMLLHEKKLDPRCILTVLRVYNQLGQTKNMLCDDTKCTLFFERAVNMYLSYTKEEEYPVPINILVGTEFPYQGDPLFQMQDLHMRALNTLISTYRKCDLQKVHSDKKYNNYLLWKHNLLRTQLSRRQFNGEFDLWILECYNLANILAKQDRFTESRNHLALVTFKLNIPQKIHINELNLPLKQNWLRTALNYSNWAYYGLELLRASKERLMRSQSCIASKINTTQLDTSESEKKPTKLLTFSDLGEELTIYNEQITDDYISDYNGAKIVFTSILRWLQYAKDICQNVHSRNTTAEQITIVLSMSAAYKYLAYYEPTSEKRIQLHSHRAKYLKASRNKLDLQCDIYSDSKVVIELALSHSMILAEQFENKVEGFVLNEETLEEINVSVKQIVKNLKLFLTMIKKVRTTSDNF